MSTGHHTRTPTTVFTIRGDLIVVLNRNRKKLRLKGALKVATIHGYIDTDIDNMAEI